MRVIHRESLALGQLTITLGADLVALPCALIAGVRNGITTGGRTGAPRDDAEAFASTAIAKLAGVVMLGGIAPANEVSIAVGLVQLRRSLVAVGGGLVGFGCGLIAIRPGLIGI